MTTNAGSSKQPEIDFKVKKFDMNMVGDNKVILFIGKRGTGKSTLVLDYLYHNRDFPCGTVISPTDEFNETYKPHIPSIFVYDEYTPELVEKFLSRQRIMVKRTLKEREYKDMDPRAFLIFDDCLYDNKSWINDRNIKWIFMNGRHGKVTFIITMQYLLGIPPGLRTQVDYLFICKETKYNNKKKMYEHYAGMFPNFEMFNKVLDECTKDRGCLVIDNSTNNDKLEDQVFWYKADLHDQFKVCLDQFWENNDAIESGAFTTGQPEKGDYSSFNKSKYNINVTKEKHKTYY
jgi:hypothetical protein|uniref:Uncharacterized protein n=1 Tax=viral metagenome TaxID=1070528 RepID=A0A6C0J832_9ZZZZ